MHHGARVRVCFRRSSGDHSRNDSSILENNTQSNGPPPLIHVSKLVLHTHVEVRVSMTCRFLDGERKRGNVHIPPMMSVAFPDVVVFGGFI